MGSPTPILTTSTLTKILIHIMMLKNKIAFLLLGSSIITCRSMKDEDIKCKKGCVGHNSYFDKESYVLGKKLFINFGMSENGRIYDGEIIWRSVTPDDTSAIDLRKPKTQKILRLACETYRRIADHHWILVEYVKESKTKRTFFSLCDPKTT